MRPPGRRRGCGGRGVAALLALALAAAPRARAQAGPDTLDLVLAGGRVVDGTGAPWVAADVGIRGDRIAAVGDLRATPARRRLDVTGLVVAPGFIDPHVHARERLFELPRAEGFLLQGLTTVVDGNDGSSPLPLAPWFRRADSARVSPNVALFVGHGTVREAVLGTADRAATADELARMRALVEGAMRDGALGLSTGLAYIPGAYASTDEVVALAQVARAHGGLYISHMRDEGAGVLAAVRETIAIGARAGIPVQVSHHKVGGRAQFGQSAQTLALMAEARAGGVDVTFDQYPYTASHTGLSLMVPRWALADDGLVARLDDPGQHARIVAGIEAFLEERFGGDPARVQLARCGFDPALGGRTLADLLRAAGQPLTAPATAAQVVALLRRGGCSAIFHAYDEGDVERLLRSPLGMIGSDGSLTALGSGMPHPRAFGTYPRVLGEYVRRRGVLSLEAAVHKMTAFPAARLGLVDRGVLRPGLMADVTVFDAATVTDRATFTDPHQYGEGVRVVLVNGVVTVEDGRHTGARAGRVLRRGGG